MKRIIRIFALMLSFAMAMSVTSLGFSLPGTSPTDRTKLSVRVNGYDVKFPDAQPYIDEAGRTMVPLRFATEALGAEVEWEQATRTAIMTKNGIVVKVSIGNNMVTIIENGVTRQVQMDTTAVLKEGRTYVPIRYVAEGLGAYVDYSNSYRTVGIYQDVLTADEIAKLHSYQRYAFMSSDVTIDDSYHKEFKESFASAREVLYDANYESPREKIFDNLGIRMDTNQEDLYFETLAKEIAAELRWNAEGLNIEFRTDASCIYADPDSPGAFFLVRGYLTISNNGYNDATKTFDNDSDARIKTIIYNNKEAVERGLGEKIVMPDLYQSITIPVDVQVEIDRQIVRAAGIVVLEQ